MISLGIDYDTEAWKVAAWDEDRAADLLTLASTDQVWDFVDDLLVAHPAAPIVLPSGFGLPVTRAKDLLDRDIAEMTLRRDAHLVDGLGQFLAEARRRSLRAYCIPAVKLLPSIPLQRKLNRVDLGTSDVLCAAVWALHSLGQAGRGHAAADFVLLHLGTSLTALLAIQAGRIVDGIGGTRDGMGPDAAPVSGDRLAALRRLAGRGHAGRTEEVEAMIRDARHLSRWEAVEKAAASLLGFHRLPELILTGGRRAEAVDSIGGRLPLATLPSRPDGYEAALGAALIAAGLTGGPTARLIDHLGIRQARERVLDWIIG